MPVQLPLICVTVVGLLYALGGRGSVGGRERAESRWRTPLFYAGLVTILIALSPPMDRLSDSLFSMHMVQHVLLLEVAAPLIVLGRPWTRVWRPFSRPVRRTVAGGMVRVAWAAPPAVAFVLMNGTFLLWHVPALYNAALTSQALHDLRAT